MEKLNDKSRVESLSSCPLCGAGRFSSIKTPDNTIGGSVFGETMALFKLVKCRQCGLEFVNPRPSSVFLSRFYDTPGYLAHDTQESSAAKCSADRFRFQLVRGIIQNATLLDYGCGGGSFAKIVKEAGWKVTGIEPSTVGRKNALDFGIETHEKIENLTVNDRFDVVTMFHVLEHIPNPAAVLSLIRKVLTDDGYLIIEVPNICSLRAMTADLSGMRQDDDEHYRAFPIHLYGYNRKTLARLLLNNGFIVWKKTSFDVGLMFRRARRLATKPSESISDSNGGKFRNGFSLKNVLKKVFFGLCLGENLVMVAKPVNLHFSQTLKVCSKCTSAAMTCG